MLVKRLIIYIVRVVGSLLLVLMFLAPSPEPGKALPDPVCRLLPQPRDQHGPVALAAETGQWEHLSAVQRLSREYQVDYRVILAIIRTESQFDHEAVSERGARGLMQIMPVTNAEVAEQLELDSIALPAANLRAGIFYFSKLLTLFPSGSIEDRLRSALAAYNAGPARVYDAQELTAYFGENPNSWKSVQHFLPLLSKRYSTLHRLVWKNGRPPSGHFGRAKETVEYVEAVMQTYARLKQPA